MEWEKNTKFAIDLNSIRMACGYKIPMGGGKNARLIGGIGRMDGDANRVNFIVPEVLGLPAGAGDTINEFDFTDTDKPKFYQVGVALENPALAQRASLVYTTTADIKLSGRQTIDTATGTEILNRPIEATLIHPQNVELKLQSGIKPGWLAMGSIKWQDWSDEYSVPVFYADDGSQFTTFTPGFRDGWTVKGGVGHAVSEKLSVKGEVQWDRGTSTGFNSSTDSWTISGGGQYALNKQVNLTLGAGLSYLTDGSATTTAPAVTYDFDNDIAIAIAAGLQVKF